MNNQKFIYEQNESPEKIIQNAIDELNKVANASWDKGCRLPIDPF